MRPMRVAVGMAILIALVVGLTEPSGAGWLSRLAREAAETGGGAAALKTGKLGLGALDNAAAHVAGLPRMSTGAALAVHVTPEGHWKFANREGAVFTAGTPDELARVGTTLAPEVAAGEKLALYLSEDTVFARRPLLKDLPSEADLYVVVGKDSYRLRRTGGVDEMVAEFRPNIVVNLSGQDLFEEAIYRLSRPLNRSNIRVLALETGGPRNLSSAPRYDAATKAALADQIDPTSLPDAIRSLKGQTALVSGRIEGNVLYFRPSSGPEQSLDIATLVHAAETADVNLVLLKSAAAHQPGARNWFWQQVAVTGLDDAMKRATFADFLSSLGGAGSELTIKAGLSSEGRVVFSAVPASSPAAPLTDTLSDWMGEVTGHVAVKSAEIYARDEKRERELEARIVPGIPSALQYAYLGSLVAGLLAWQVSFAWWSRIWPPEQRQEYASRAGYSAARMARFLAGILIFLPLVGLPALLWLGILQLWAVLTAPFRGWKWLRQRFG
jgi:hypothetical protein